jgi:hypothetical protein
MCQCDSWDSTNLLELMSFCSLRRAGVHDIRGGFTLKAWAMTYWLGSGPFHTKCNHVVASKHAPACREAKSCRHPTRGNTEPSLTEKSDPELLWTTWPHQAPPHVEAGPEANTQVLSQTLGCSFNRYLGVLVTCRTDIVIYTHMGIISRH